MVSSVTNLRPPVNRRRPKATAHSHHDAYFKANKAFKGNNVNSGLAVAEGLAEQMKIGNLNPYSVATEALTSFFRLVYTPIVMPIESLDVASRHMIRKLPIDIMYGALYKISPTFLLKKASAKILDVLGMKKEEKLADKAIGMFLRLYDPEFWKEVGISDNLTGRADFFNKLFHYGDLPYEMVAEHFVGFAMRNGSDVFKEKLLSGKLQNPAVFIKEFISDMASRSAQILEHGGEALNELKEHDFAEDLQKIKDTDFAELAEEKSKQSVKMATKGIENVKTKIETGREKIQNISKETISKSADKVKKIKNESVEAINNRRTKAKNNKKVSGPTKTNYGTKNLSFTGQVNEPKGIVNKITGTISGVKNSVIGFLKSLPIPGLGGGNSPATQPA